MKSVKIKTLLVAGAMACSVFCLAASCGGGEEAVPEAVKGYKLLAHNEMLTVTCDGAFDSYYYLYFAELRFNIYASSVCADDSGKVLANGSIYYLEEEALYIRMLDMDNELAFEKTYVDNYEFEVKQNKNWPESINKI